MKKQAMAKIVKISKQELSTEKVELSQVDDLIKWAKSGSNKFEVLADFNNYAKKKQGEINDEIRIAEQKLKEVNKFLQIAKSAGFDDYVDSLSFSENLIKQDIKQGLAIRKIIQDGTNNPF